MPLEANKRDSDEFVEYFPGLQTYLPFSSNLTHSNNLVLYLKLYFSIHFIATFNLEFGTHNNKTQPS